ncbi:thioredoxin family protein [Caldimonas sp. KR1-144]|uniref:thioredoxin family protein n=1 Tax=Caldimonas sp. KR1-144 TaxID=3400911 RepID=UPI003C11EE26
MNLSPLSRLLRAFTSRSSAVVAAIAALLVAIGHLATAGGPELGTPVVRASGAAMPALTGATGWINSPPMTTEDLRGKVVLVDFWTYSCINCLRTLPHIKAWAQKYKPHGLVVLGVHSPEFDFERSQANVLRATRDLGIDYPVVVDSNHALWRAFGTYAWPTLLFVDAQGRIRHRQLGEGGYEKAERVIQQLLREAGMPGVPDDLVAPQGKGTQAAPSPVPADSGETYVGYARTSGFTAADGGIRQDRPHTYGGAKSLRLGQWTLSGAWTVGAEHAALDQAGGRIALRFRARDLHLVLGPPQDGGRPVRFRVRIDGQPPQGDRGTDVDAEGFGQVDAQRLYQLVRQSSGSAERQFEIEFLDPGVRAYAFTFG